MKSSHLKTLIAVIAIGVTTPTIHAQSTGTASSAYEPDAIELRTVVKLLRSDVRTEKAMIVAANLELSSDESAEFWPIQREYEFQVNRLLDERLEMIMEFLPKADAMGDDEAKALAKAAFDLEEKRTALKRATFKKFCEVIPAAKAVRFFQIENQLNAAIDLRVMDSLPLIQ